jgi:hypothetical protein
MRQQVPRSMAGDSIIDSREFVMRLSPFAPSLVAVLAAAFAYGAAAATPAASEEDHAAHHPASAASASQAPKPAPAPAKPAASQSAIAMDKQMMAMREMHEKMMAAKTPEERQTLMADHVKTMKGGMSTMGQSRDMEKRMEMRESMMQMMMDRMEAMPAK